MTRECWVSTVIKRNGAIIRAPFRRAMFHCWTQDHEEFEGVPGPFPAAIVEDPSGKVHVVDARYVHFGEIPDGPIDGEEKSR